MGTGDFWFLAGVALVCVGIGQCSRLTYSPAEKTPEAATAELIEACALRVRLGFDVPEICRPDKAASAVVGKQ